MGLSQEQIDALASGEHSPRNVITMGRDVAKDKEVVSARDAHEAEMNRLRALEFSRAELFKARVENYAKRWPEFVKGAHESVLVAVSQGHASAGFITDGNNPDREAFQPAMLAHFRELGFEVTENEKGFEVKLA